MKPKIESYIETLGRPATVRATRWIRKMRGGAQAHLVEASDGHRYVVKFLQNPQGHRILVNELISSVLLQKLGIATPEIAFVSVDQEFLDKNPDCCLGSHNHSILIQPGVHFGSRYPDGFENCSVYDFLPEAYLRQVYNREHFLGVLVFDKWVSNGDFRQAVFFRAKVVDDGESKGTHFVALMIDNGSAFDGQDWRFGDSPIQGIYLRIAAYGDSVSMRDFAPWLAALRRITRRRMLRELRSIVPDEWIRGEEHELERLLNCLYERRKLLPDLLQPAIEMINAHAKHAQRAPRPCGIVALQIEPKGMLSRVKEFVQPIASHIGYRMITGPLRLCAPLTR